MKLALARVGEKKSHWSRADLIGAMSAVMPDSAATLPPDEAARLVESLVSALYEADARSGQAKGARSRQAELEAG